MSILLIIAIILLISASKDWSDAEEWKASEDLEDMRHEEMMDLQRELHDDLKGEIRKSSRRNRGPVYKDRKRYIKDKHGNIIAEEYLTRSGRDYDLDDDDFDDFDDDYDDDDLDY